MKMKDTGEEPFKTTWKSRFPVIRKIMSKERLNHFLYRRIIPRAGLIRIAQFTGQPIVPAITSAQKKWTFNSWDRFMVPKPFSRVIIRFADPIHIPSQMSPLQFEQQRRAVKKHLAGLYAETDRIWDEPKKAAALFN